MKNMKKRNEVDLLKEMDDFKTIYFSNKLKYINNQITDSKYMNKDKIKTIRVGTAFSGIGAFEQALEILDLPHEIVFACDNGGILLEDIAKKEECGVALFIDEIQYLKDEEFEALIAAIHRVNQKDLPLIIFAAGLPKIAKIAGDVKSYAERLFQFTPIGSLEEDGALALTEPALKWSVSYEKEAVDEILKVTESYPYFLQEYGKQVWRKLDERKIITTAMVKEAYPDFIKSLDESFFKVRHDRATPKELEFMIAMVKVGKLPCNTKDIAKNLNLPLSSISPIRAQLIHKGFIYAANRGEVDFTVPQFDSFLKRIHKI